MDQIIPLRRIYILLCFIALKEMEGTSLGGKKLDKKRVFRRFQEEEGSREIESQQP